MEIVHVTNDNTKIWARLCNELWPNNSVDEMLAGFAANEYKNEYMLCLDGLEVAFISLSIRTDYVEGKADSKPVGYMEGIYVKPEYRRAGIARTLVSFAREWSAENGCSMLASDCELANEQSRLFHNKIGFTEVSTNVHFTMQLG